MTIYASEIAGLDGQYPNIQKLISGDRKGVELASLLP